MHAEQGGILWRERYTPFGEQLLNPAANDNLDGFTGHIKDKATGLNPCIFRDENCTVQARYYDPVIGRFLSIDPVTFMDTNDPRMFNRYAYTFNDPVNLTDPTGECPMCIGFVVGFALDVAVQKITNPDAKIDFRQAGISGAAGAVGAGVGQKLYQGFKAVGAAKSTVHVAHQAAAGAGVNVAAGAVNNVTDGDASTGITDGALTNAATGAIGAAGGTVLGDALDAAGEVLEGGVKASVGTSAAKGIAKAAPDVLSNSATQAPNVEIRDDENR